MMSLIQAKIMSRIHFPCIRTAGFDGLLVSFGEALSEPANRAALALRSVIEHGNWNGVEETSTSLVSVYVRFDPLCIDHQQMRTQLQTLLDARDWFAETLPEGRTLWRIPTVFGTPMAPQLEEAAALAGMSASDAVSMISSTRVRVQTVGFAPGTPYLGELPPAWDIPRQTQLTKQVPIGALTVAIRQMVFFSVSAPTGWRHIGQTAFRLFRPDTEQPFILRPGDEVLFEPTNPELLANMQDDPDGGARHERLS